ncbi:MAG: ATP-binding cassette domain-containing protein, partial [Clostridia bacterium]
MPILEVNDLAISFTQYTGGLHQQKLQVVQGVELSVQKGEIVAIVGASGSGKSLLAHAIMGILPENAEMTGTIRYKGELLTAAKQEQLRG